MARGRKQPMVALLSDDVQPTESISVPPRQWTRLVGVPIKRQFLVPGGINLAAAIVDINEKVRNRGFVLEDGQFLTCDLTVESLPADGIVRFPAKPFGSVDVDRNVFVHREEGSYDVGASRPWGPAHISYFGYENPYQLAEEASDYTWSNLTTRLHEPYLRPSELVAALVHGVKDNHYFNCPCHYPHVVYTTHHRLACLGCGFMHAVLAQPLSLKPARLLGKV